MGLEMCIGGRGRTTVMLILRDRNGRVWLEQRPQQGIWGGLWCFPQTDDESQMDDALKVRAFDARAGGLLETSDAADGRPRLIFAAPRQIKTKQLHKRM